MFCNKYRDCKFDCVHKVKHDRIVYEEGTAGQYFCSGWGWCPMTDGKMVRCLDDTKNLKAWEI